MGVYKRQLKAGLKWRFDGSFKGKHYTSPAIYKTQEAAQQAEQKYLLRLRGDTLGVLADARLDFLKIRKVNKDYFNNSRYNLYKVIDFFGYEYPIRELGKREAYEVLQHLALEWQLANCTSHPANKFIRCLKAFFYWCIDIKEIEVLNPFQKMKFLPIDHQKKYIPTQVQTYKVWQPLKGLRKILFRFVDETGCRINEAVDLTVEDIYPDTLTLWTRKAKNSDRVPRVIPRPEWFDNLPEEGRVFNLWNAYPRYLGEKVKELGQEPHWNWHNLRHRRASLWAKVGMPPYEIMSRLGHSNLSTALLYLQLLGFSSG